MDTINRHYYKNITLEQALIGGNFKIRVEDGHTIKVNLKPGSYNGQVIRLTNLNDQIKCDHIEDTLITLKVLDHPIYHINGLNLEAIVAITPAEAKLGTQKKLPGPEGDTISIEIHKDTQEDEKIIIPNKGLRRKETSGDIIFQVKIENLILFNDEIINKIQTSKKPDILN